MDNNRIDEPDDRDPGRGLALGILIAAALWLGVVAWIFS